MKDPRFRGIVSKFAERYSFSGTDADKFQKFTNYVLLKHYYYLENGCYPYESFIDNQLLTNIDFDNEAEKGMAVDGCFVLHGKSIIHPEMDETEMEEIFSKIKEGTITVVLIQTKSGKLEPTDLSTLSDCLSTKFDKQTKWDKFLSIRNFCESVLYREKDVKIKFVVIYATGVEIPKEQLENETFIVRESSLKLSMRDFFWTSSDLVEIHYTNESDLYSKYSEQLSVSKSVSRILKYSLMTNSLDCHSHGNIKFGAIPVSELLKILLDSSGHPNELYEYNVRDAIFSSTVNADIKNTLSSSADMFLLLNNGITMVVDKQEKRGDDGIYLENIRIVNGCQTCNAIVSASKENDAYKDAQVPVKIIETTEKQILSRITYSSNRQNAVTSSNLFAIEPEVFQLESKYSDLFLAYPNTIFDEVKFERRQGQYNGDTLVKYIDIMAQAKAYISLWNLSPDKAIRYAESIIEMYKAHLHDDSFIVRSLFAGVVWNSVSQQITENYKNARYHIFTIVALELLGVESNFSDLQTQLDLKTDEDIYRIVVESRLDISLIINKVKTAIDNLSDYFPKTTKGKIHYRKFYPREGLQRIYESYRQV